MTLPDYNTHGRQLDVTPVGWEVSATASGVTPAFENGDGRTMRLALEATTVDGTDPSLTVAVQCSPDAHAENPSPTWYTVATFTALTAPSVVAERLPIYVDRFVRLNYTLSGEDTEVAFTANGEIV